MEAQTWGQGSAGTSEDRLKESQWHGAGGSPVLPPGEVTLMDVLQESYLSPLRTPPWLVSLLSMPGMWGTGGMVAFLP